MSNTNDKKEDFDIEKESKKAEELLAKIESSKVFNKILSKIMEQSSNIRKDLDVYNTNIRGRIKKIDSVVDKMKKQQLPITEMYDLLALIGSTGRYVIKRVFKKNGEIAAAVSTDKLNMLAGEYVGKDDPVAIVRAQSGFPANGECVEPFAFPHMVSGWMRGSHNGPMMPVSEAEANPIRFDGPPRVVGLGFQVANGELVGPVDLFDDPAFDPTREQAAKIATYIRRHGPFEPHRLPAEEMEYTSLPGVMEKLESRFEDME